jgi:hypothetical protein
MIYSSLVDALIAAPAWCPVPCDKLNCWMLILICTRNSSLWFLAGLSRHTWQRTNCTCSEYETMIVSPWLLRFAANVRIRSSYLTSFDFATDPFLRFEALSGLHWFLDNLLVRGSVWAYRQIFIRFLQLAPHDQSNVMESAFFTCVRSFNEACPNVQIEVLLVLHVDTLRRLRSFEDIQNKSFVNCDEWRVITSVSEFSRRGSGWNLDTISIEQRLFFFWSPVNYNLIRCSALQLRRF